MHSEQLRYEKLTRTCFLFSTTETRWRAFTSALSAALRTFGASCSAPCVAAVFVSPKGRFLSRASRRSSSRTGRRATREASIGVISLALASVELGTFAQSIHPWNLSYLAEGFSFSLVCANYFTTR